MGFTLLPRGERAAISLDDRLRRGLDACYLDLLPDEHIRYLGGDVGLPVVTLIDRRVQPFPLFLTLEAADPDVQIVFLLPHKAPEDHHAFGDLERNDLLFHEL